MITGQIEAPVDEADDFFDPMEFLEKVNEDPEENNDHDIINNENNETNDNLKNTDDIKKTIKTEDSKMNATIKNDKSEEMVEIITLTIQWILKQMRWMKSHCRRIRFVILLRAEVLL